MNDQDKALNETEEPKVDTAPVPVEVPEEATNEVVNPAGEITEEAAETEVAPKKGFNQRISELTRERDEWKAKAENKSLADKMTELTGSEEPMGPQASQYEPSIEPGSEISPEQYKADVMRAADSLVTLKLKQSEAITRINNESRDIVRKYPELDPESDSFNKELSDSITEATEAYVKSAPYTASVSKFVEKLMKPYKGAVEKQVGKVTETIAKQVSETALRPTNVRKPEKDFSQKSIEEMEKELGIVHT